MVAAISNGLQVNANTSSSLTGLSDSYNTFLQILATQLQNQDPLEPTDTAQFTNQLVMYSQVEQQIKSNANLTNMLESLAQSQNTGAMQLALGYVGMDVEALGDKFQFTPAQQPGQKLSFKTVQDFSDARINIADKDGNIIFTKDIGKMDAGNQSFDWNGKDNQGRVVPAGDYKISISSEAAGLDPQKEEQAFAYNFKPGMALSYELEKDASNAKATILDKNGNIVRKMDVSLKKGLNNFEWDGRDESGNLMPEGQYQVKIAAFDKDKAEVKSLTFVPGRITGVEFKDGQLVLNMGDVIIGLADIRSASRKT